MIFSGDGTSGSWCLDVDLEVAGRLMWVSSRACAKAAGT